MARMTRPALTGEFILVERKITVWEHFVTHWYEGFLFAGAILAAHWLGFRVM